MMRFLTRVSMKDGLSGAQLADHLEDHLRSLGIEVELERIKFEGAVMGDHNLPVAGTYFQAVSAVDEVIKEVRESLDPRKNIYTTKRAPACIKNTIS